MEEDPTASIAQYFKSLKDPRIDRTKRHSLNDILVMTICAVVGGADGWVGVEKFCKAKEKWLRTFLELSHGRSVSATGHRTAAGPPVLPFPVLPLPASPSVLRARDPHPTGLKIPPTSRIGAEAPPTRTPHHRKNGLGCRVRNASGLG